MLSGMIKVTIVMYCEDFSCPSNWLRYVIDEPRKEPLTDVLFAFWTLFREQFSMRDIFSYLSVIKEP